MNPSPSLGRDEVANPVLDELIAEITDKLQAGEAVDVETYAAAHPEVAAELRRLLPALELLAVVGSRPGSEVASDEVRREPSLHGELGDFRLLREVGRGGMGVVYEAEQISLRRRVALKVLPFAATMDARHLQRFHNEAQAAACLHHTNIVPVFFVGCERGVHFYAMQFIDGQPLSDLIRQLCGREKTASVPVGAERTEVYQPTPGDAPATMPPAAEMTPLTGEGKRGRDYYRKVAELGVQAAEALDHAHQLGIVHRDIKPANLLVDSRGNLWVTDFGLAHIQQSETNLTVTGQALGTPRYMSPEQALAKRVPIDHRTDVYSLGATLYELLTLRPAFGSENRHELMRQIAFEEPVRLRRLERAIPAELEIIVLKAMEKRPQDRYATAQDLADDLERWLKHEPIRAKRPGMVQRAAKWGRRHRPLVVAATLSLLLALVLLAISNVVIWHEHEETKEALQKARLHQQEIDLLVARMKGDRDESELKLERALEVMDRTLTALEEPFPEEGTEAARIYKAASEQALKFYQDVLPIQTRRPSLLCEMMWAYVRLGNLCALRDEFDEARQAYGKVDSVANKLLAFRRIIGPNGSLAGEPRDRPAIEKVYRRALAHWRKTSPKGLDEIKDYRITIQVLRSGWNKIENGDTMNLWPHVSHQERVRVLERVVEDLPTLSYVYKSLAYHIAYGDDLHKAGRVEEAKAVYRLALKDVEKGVRNTASNKERQADMIPYLADKLVWVGCHLDDLGMSAEAESAIRLGLGFNEQLGGETHRELYLVHDMKRLVDQDGKLSALFSGQRQPADNAERLVLAWMSQHYKMRFAAATRFYRDAFAAEPKAADDLNAQYRYNAARAAVRAGCGEGNDADKLDDKERARLRQQALDWLRADLEAYRQGMDKSADMVGSDIEQWIKRWLWINNFASVRDSESLAELPEAERQQWKQLWQVVQTLKQHADNPKDDSRAHYKIGNDLRKKGRLDEAIAEYHEAIRINKDFALVHNNLGAALYNKGQLDEAIAEYREAIRLKKDFAEAHLDLGALLEQKGQFAEALVHRRRGHELGSKNPDWPYPSAQWVRNCERLVELDGKLPLILSGQKQPTDTAERLALARLCQMPCKKRYVSAVRFFSDAFDENPKLADDLDTQHRYNAACAAALAGCGQGNDAAKLDDKERPRLRQQALDWLRADLEAYRQGMDKIAGKTGPEIAKRLQHWLQDTDFAGVRGEAVLHKLPEAERPPWQKLWQDVEALRQQAATKTNLPTDVDDLFARRNRPERIETLQESSAMSRQRGLSPHFPTHGS